MNGSKIKLPPCHNIRQFIFYHRTIEYPNRFEQAILLRVFSFAWITGYTQYKYAPSKRNRTEGIENPLRYDLCVDQCIFCGGMRSGCNSNIWYKNLYTLSIWHSFHKIELKIILLSRQNRIDNILLLQSEFQLMYIHHNTNLYLNLWKCMCTVRG